MEKPLAHEVGEGGLSDQTRREFNTIWYYTNDV
jgi:hypothetical protein